MLRNPTARLQRAASPGRRLSRSMVAGALVCAFVAMVGCRGVPTQPGPKPPSGTAKRPPPGYFVYVLQRSDTLYSLGRRFHVPWAEILDVNEIKRPEDLQAGSEILIPKTASTATPERPAQEAEPTRPARTAVARADLHHGNPSAQYWWPTQGRIVWRYGARLRGLVEPGIGIAAPVGLEVCAVAAGTVITCVHADPSMGSAWGNVVAISHPDGMVSWYAQLDRILVEKGAQVSKGQPIGTVGTGADGRAGIGFRLFHNDHPVNPQDYLP